MGETTVTSGNGETTVTIPKATRTARRLGEDPTPPVPTPSQPSRQATTMAVQGGAAGNATTAPVDEGNATQPVAEGGNGTPESAPTTEPTIAHPPLEEALRAGMSATDASKIYGLSARTIYARAKKLGIELQRKRSVTTRKPRSRPAAPATSQPSATPPVRAEDLQPATPRVSADRVGDAAYLQALGLLAEASLRSGIPLSDLVAAGTAIR